jgi:DeoR/GlpR family transcriptional regulator of sugar metabolism
VNKKGNTEKRTEERLNKILKFLPFDNKGKTYEEVSDNVGYSIATVRTDLKMLKGQHQVDCTSERPIKWFKTNPI